MFDWFSIALYNFNVANILLVFKLQSPLLLIFVKISNKANKSSCVLKIMIMFATIKNRIK